MEQILSQDEVDALLKGIAGGEIEEPEEATDEGAGYVRYDFTKQEGALHIRMPAMEVINDSFLRAIRSSLSAMLRRILDITATPMEFDRFGAFVRTLPVPSSLQIFKMDPFRGHALIVLQAAGGDPSVYDLKDSIYQNIGYLLDGVGHNRQCPHGQQHVGHVVDGHQVGDAMHQRSLTTQFFEDSRDTVTKVVHSRPSTPSR